MTSRCTDSRRELYDQGSSDASIAACIGVSRRTVSQWRKTQGLPANGGTTGSVDTIGNWQNWQSLGDERRRLHALGKSDAEIGKATGASRNTIAKWRKVRGMPPGDAEAKKDNRAALYQSGLTDKAIADAVGVTLSSIMKWRQNNSLPSHAIRGRPTRSATAIEAGQSANDERRELHAAGLFDSEIAERIGVKPKAIRDWRGVRGIKSNAQVSISRKIRDYRASVLPRHERRALSLFAVGMGANAVKAGLGLSSALTSRLRTQFITANPECRGQVPPKPSASMLTPSGALRICLSPEKRRRALELYADGLGDASIANEIEVSSASVGNWRRLNYLPARPKRYRATAAKEESAAAHYAEGFADAEIANALGWTRETVRRWRDRNKLVPHIKPRALIVHREKPAYKPALTPHTNATYRAIFNAIGRGMADDLRDDAISELWIAMAEGRLDLEAIQKYGRREAWRIAEKLTDSRRNRSIDAEIGEDGFTLLDVMRDENAADWLEEMGATVW